MGERMTLWRRSARRELIELRGSAPGWGYRAAAASAVEPTVLSCLGLLATRDVGDEMGFTASADWLATIQQPDGSLGSSATRGAPGWTTPLGLLLWQALSDHEPQRRRAVAWLLRAEGKRIPRADDPEGIVGHDTTLAGWPWVGGTHSWLEPTALAVLALRRAGLADHPRVVEGLRLIRDRAIATGGWNYGNKSAFGHALRPQPGPTGLALLALAPLDGRTPIVAQAIDYLLETLPGVRASASLGWGLLGLRAWDSVPPAAEAWLAEAFERATGRPDAPVKLAMLLLAGGDHARDLFS
jgi:hypothetical protein